MNNVSGGTFTGRIIWINMLELNVRDEVCAVGEVNWNLSVNL